MITNKIGAILLLLLFLDISYLKNLFARRKQWGISP